MGDSLLMQIDPLQVNASSIKDGPTARAGQRQPRGCTRRQDNLEVAWQEKPLQLQTKWDTIGRGFGVSPRDHQSQPALTIEASLSLILQSHF